MRVTQRTPDYLVIEDAPDIVFGAGAAGLGGLAILIAWIEEFEWIFLVVGILFFLFGLKMLLFAPTTTHRRASESRGAISPARKATRSNALKR